MLKEHDRQTSNPNSPFSMDEEGIKTLLVATLPSFVDKNNCKCENETEIHRSNPDNIEHYVDYGSFHNLSIINFLNQGNGAYSVKGTLLANYKSTEGNLFLDVKRCFSAKVIIANNEKEEAVIQKLIEFKLS